MSKEKRITIEIPGQTNLNSFGKWVSLQNYLIIQESRVDYSKENTSPCVIDNIDMNKEIFVLRGLKFDPTTLELIYSEEDSDTLPEGKLIRVYPIMGIAWRKTFNSSIQMPFTNIFYLDDKEIPEVLDIDKEIKEIDKAKRKKKG
jgi:hypothetical protein